MRLAIFGGSFDPPTLGHTMACLWALESGEVDRVLLIPVAHHAFGKEPGADFPHRLAMCRLATGRLGGGVQVLDIEARRPGISYTIDTLDALAAEFPGARFRLLTGSDVAAQIGKWRRGDEVLRRAPLLEIPRPLAGESTGDRPGALAAISSTAARNALAAADPTASLFLGAAVRQYIRQHGLYTTEATPERKPT